MKNDNKKFWERVAKFYTPLQEKTNATLYQKVANRIQPYLQTSFNVLEIACGTGQFTHLLAPYVHQWIATDFSEKMVSEAKKQALDHVQYEIADATQLHYHNHMFDVVFIANALHIMPNPKQALNESKRVLKQDGYLIVPTFVYEGKINTKKLWVLSKLGFKTYYKWNFKQYQSFIEEQGFLIVDAWIIKDKMLPEAIIIAKKQP